MVKRAILSVLVGALLLLAPAAGAAEDYPGGKTTREELPTNVMGNAVDSADTAVSPALETSPAQSSAPAPVSTLPVTGGDIVALTAFGIALVGVGLVLRNRGTRTAA